MKRKNLLFCFAFFAVSMLSAQLYNWEVGGSVKEIASRESEFIYKAHVNNISHHSENTKLSSIYIKLYEKNKMKKKDKSRFCMISFTIRLSPFFDEYDRYQEDSVAPFRNLAFGFHRDVLNPQMYENIDLLITSCLYRLPWITYYGAGAGNTKTETVQKTAKPLHPYISFRGNSIRYAPVLVEIVHDRQKQTMGFYMNGVLQKKIPLHSITQDYSAGTLALIWDRERNSSERRQFQISQAKVVHTDEEPVIKPLTADSVLMSDPDFEQAKQLLYGEKNHWEEGFSEMKKLASREHALAVFELARCYAAGIGTKKDVGLALKYAKQAAVNDVTEAIYLYRNLVGWKGIPADLRENIVKIQGNGNISPEQDLADQEGFVKIAGNTDRFADAINFTLKGIRGEKRSVLLNLLKQLANTENARALYLYAKECGNDGEYETCLKKSAALREPEAIREMLDRNLVKWEKLDLLSRSVYAKTFLMEYSGITGKNTDKEFLQELRNVCQSSDRTPRQMFALSEYLLLPVHKNNKVAAYEAEQLMAEAAGTEPLAQAVYIQRYLADVYGDKAHAEQMMKKLLQTHKDDLFVQELKLLLLEKWSPKKWKRHWETLAKKNSAEAFYQLGNYAAAAKQKDSAAVYRSQFLKLYSAQNYRAGSGICFSGTGQYFAGFLDSAGVSGNKNKKK